MGLADTFLRSVRHERLQADRAIFGQALTRLFEVLDHEPEMVDADEVHASTKLIGLEVEDGHVDRAIAKVNSFGDGRIGAPAFDHVKHALVKLRGLFWIRGVHGYVSQLGHRASF